MHNFQFFKNSNSKELELTETASLNDVNLESLCSVYKVENTDLKLSSNPQNYLYHGTIPKKTFILEGKGAVLKTNKGDVIDLSAMVLNCVLGQNDPWIKANQIAYLLSDRPSYTSISLGGHELYYQFPQRLAELKIGGISDPVINFRQCNGSDAIEVAILAARAYADKEKKNRPTLVSFKGSYHGQSLMAFLVSETQNKNVFLVPKSNNVVFLDIPPHASNVNAEELSQEEQAVLKQLEKISQETFGVLIEPIQMNNGAHTFSKAFLKALNKICKENDICFILDEIQTGMGWLGDLTAAEKFKLKPDIIALSKGLTGGNGPLALIVAEKKYNYLPDCTAGKTNGADIRSIVAANAVLDRLLGLPKEKIIGVSGKLYEELCTGLLPRIKNISEEIDLHLQNLKNEFPNIIGDSRGYGVIRMIQILDEKTNLPDQKLANAIHLAGPDNGVFVRNSGGHLIIKPPLTITTTELKLAFQNLKKTIDVCLEQKKEQGYTYNTPT